MVYDLVDNVTYEEIKDVLINTVPEDVVNCFSLEVFNEAKKVLIDEKLTEKTLQLLDDEDYVLQQVTSKKRQDHFNRGAKTRD